MILILLVTKLQIFMQIHIFINLNRGFSRLLNCKEYSTLDILNTDSMHFRILEFRINA